MAEHTSSPPLIGLLLRLLHRHHADAVHAALDRAGFGDIRAPHASVLPFVPPEGIRVSEIARLAHVRKQTTAETVEQLERLGYVERRPDPSDRRARLVFLTARGEAMRPVTLRAGREVERRWAQLTSTDDIEQLRAVLTRLLARLGDEAGGAPVRKG